MRSLNAPFGAWCFLTRTERVGSGLVVRRVLMHLMVLGAF